jgi:hypothetical protein
VQGGEAEGASGDGRSFVIPARLCSTEHLGCTGDRTPRLAVHDVEYGVGVAHEAIAGHGCLRILQVSRRRAAWSTVDIAQNSLYQTA